MTRIADLLLRWPGLTIVALVLATTAASLGLAQRRVDNEIRNLFRSSPGRVAQLEPIDDQCGSRDARALIVVVGPISSRRQTQTTSQARRIDSGGPKASPACAACRG